MNKKLEIEYFITKEAEATLTMDFVKYLGDKKLLKFLNLNKRRNSDHDKPFYSNVRYTIENFLCRFRGNLMSFPSLIMEHLGPEYNGLEVGQSQVTHFKRVNFVESIPKYIFYNHMEFSNIHISQMQCEMQMLH